MPSTKKRINLTVPEHIYNQLQIYKEQNGISNDASACMQLIVQQLKAHENGLLMKKILLNATPESLTDLSAEGFTYLLENFGQSPTAK